MEDQASVSSGYVYQSNSKLPMSYVHFSRNPGDSAAVPSTPIIVQHAASVQNQPLLHQSSSYYPAFYYHPLTHLEVKSDLEEDVAEPLNENYEKDSGEKYDESNYATKGEKGQDGYKTEEAIDEKLSKTHDNKQDEGYYKENGGDKKAHYEAGKQYASEDEKGGSSNGESYSESKGHKKGSNTSGYHKVYHKDEYKKDHSFYDESNKEGHFDKYGNSHSHKSAENGGFEEGGHSDAGFQENKQGEEGAYNKGSYDKKDQKYKKGEGSNKYINNQSDYAKQGGKESKNSYDYAEDD